MTYGPQSIFATVREDKVAMEVLERHLPGIAAEDDAFLQPFLSIRSLSLRLRRFGDALPALDALWAELASLEPRPERVVEPPAPPSPNYEAETVPAGSATVEIPVSSEAFAAAELRLLGPSHGNPFVDVELSA